MCMCVFCSESDIPKVRLDLLQQKSLMKLAVRLLRNYNLPEGPLLYLKNNNSNIMVSVIASMCTAIAGIYLVIC